MFGRSKEKTMQDIVSIMAPELEKLLPYYEDGVRFFTEQVEGKSLEDEEVAEEFFTNYQYMLSNYYLKAVEAIFKGIARKFPRTEDKLNDTFGNPRKCGYDVSFGDPLSAGIIFAICYYSITGKIAPPGYCMQMNHFQHELFEEVLQKIDNPFLDALQ